MNHPLTDGDDLAWWLIEKAIEEPGGAGGAPPVVYGSTPISYGGNGDVIIGQSTTQADPKDCGWVCGGLGLVLAIIFLCSRAEDRSYKRRLDLQIRKI